MTAVERIEAAEAAFEAACEEAAAAHAAGDKVAYKAAARRCQTLSADFDAAIAAARFGIAA